MKRWRVKDRRRVVAGRRLLARPDTEGVGWARGGVGEGEDQDWCNEMPCGRHENGFAERESSSTNAELKHTHTVFSLVVAPEQRVSCCWESDYSNWTRSVLKSARTMHRTSGWRGEGECVYVCEQWSLEVESISRDWRQDCLSPSPHLAAPTKLLFSSTGTYPSSWSPQRRNLTWRKECTCAECTSRMEWKSSKIQQRLTGSANTKPLQSYKAPIEVSSSKISRNRHTTATGNFAVLLQNA